MFGNACVFIVCTIIFRGVDTRGGVVKSQPSHYSNTAGLFKIKRDLSTDAPSIWGISDRPVYEADVITVRCTWYGTMIKLFCPENNSVSGINKAGMHLVITRSMFNKTCTCQGIYSGKIVTTTSKAFIVYYKPELQIDVHLTPDANVSASITCYIYINGYPPEIKYNSWKHKWKDTLIRVIPGIVYSRSSKITFVTMRYDDSGNYECSVENGKLPSGRVLRQTVAKEVKVPWKPIFGEQATILTIIPGGEFLFGVSFVAFPNYTTILCRKLTTEHQLSFNASKYHVMKQNISLLLHNVRTVWDGYKAVLVFKHFTYKDLGIYSVNISNPLGWEEEEFFFTSSSILEQKGKKKKEKPKPRTRRVHIGVAVGTFFAGAFVCIFLLLCGRYLYTSARKTLMEEAEVEQVSSESETEK